MKNMKLAALLFTGFFMLGISRISTAQTQLNNSGFEDWENVGSATEEPLEWNSFKTASGILATYASQQINKSSVVRPGSTGTSSCLIWSKNIIGVIANGNVTTGQINMANMTPTNTDNYNITHTADAAFSEALGVKPDSIVFWARFKPVNTGGTDSARMRAVIHDTYDYRDPSGSDANAPNHVVGEATRHIATTNGQWMRVSVPFTYGGPATSPDFVLVTFTTNKTPGGGSGGDSLYIDDISLIYNGLGISDVENTEKLFAFTDANNINIDLSLEKSSTSEIAVYNVYGQMVYQTEVEAQNIQHQINVSTFAKGIYIVAVTTEDNRRFTQKISVK